HARALDRRVDLPVRGPVPHLGHVVRRNHAGELGGGPAQLPVVVSTGDVLHGRERPLHLRAAADVHGRDVDLVPDPPAPQVRQALGGGEVLERLARGGGGQGDGGARDA